MAVYTVAAGQLAVHDKTLAANVVDAINFDVDPSAVEIQTDGTAAIYVTTDGSTPTVGGANTHLIPATAGSRFIRHGGDRGLRLISAGTPTYSITKISAQDIGEGRLADRMDSLESSRGEPDGIATLDGDGQVPVDQLGNASGGGGGADLSAVEEIDFVVGADPAKVSLRTDAENNGPASVALYPVGGSDRSGLSLFNDGVLPDGSSVGDSRGPYLNGVAFPGMANFGASMWTSQASATFQVSAADDGDPFKGRVTVSQDNDADTSGIAIWVKGILSVKYDGSVVLDTAGAGVTFESPDGLTTKTLSIDNSGDPVWT